jgi:hypothetical protein
MQILITLPDGLVARALDEASAGDMSMDEYIQNLVMTDTKTKTLPRTFKQQPQKLLAIHDLIDACNQLCKVSTDKGNVEGFTVEEMYEELSKNLGIGGNWESVHPNERKRLGREFAAEIRNITELTAVGAKHITRIGRTIQNKALYAVRTKY